LKTKSSPHILIYKTGSVQAQIHQRLWLKTTTSVLLADIVARQRCFWFSYR